MSSDLQTHMIYHFQHSTQFPNLGSKSQLTLHLTRILNAIFHLPILSMQVSEKKVHNHGGHFNLPFRGLPAEIRMTIWHLLVPESIDLNKVCMYTPRASSPSLHE